jgi:hypothetical protein
VLGFEWCLLGFFVFFVFFDKIYYGLGHNRYWDLYIDDDDDYYKIYLGYSYDFRVGIEIYANCFVQAFLF